MKTLIFVLGTIVIALLSQVQAYQPYLITNVERNMLLNSQQVTE